MKIAQGPGKFRVDFEIEISLALCREFVRGETVEPDQPVGLIQPMLPYQRRRNQRQLARRIWNRTESGIVDTPQFMPGVKRTRLLQNIGIRRVRRPNNHLGALSCRSEGWGLDVFPSIGLCFFYSFFDSMHRRMRVIEILLWRQTTECVLRRQFNIDANAISPSSRFLNQLGRRLRDRFKMDVTAELMRFAQRPRDRHDLFHRVIGIANNARAQEQAFDVIATIEIERQLDHFHHSETRALHVAGGAVYAEKTIKDANIR